MNCDSSTCFPLFSSVKAKKESWKKEEEIEEEKRKLRRGRESVEGLEIFWVRERVARGKRGLAASGGGVTGTRRWLSFLTQRCKCWLYFLPLLLLCDFSHSQSPQQLAVCTSFALIGARLTGRSIFMEAWCLLHDYLPTSNISKLTSCKYFFMISPFIISNTSRSSKLIY